MDWNWIIHQFMVEYGYGLMRFDLLALLYAAPFRAVAGFLSSSPKIGEMV